MVIAKFSDVCNIAVCYMEKNKEAAKEKYSLIS
jgi:hypothetical protein